MSDADIYQSRDAADTATCGVAEGVSSVICGLERELCRYFSARPLRWLAVAASVGFVAGLMVCRRRE